MLYFPKFRVHNSRYRPTDGKNCANFTVDQAFPQDPLPNHSCGTEE